MAAAPETGRAFMQEHRRAIADLGATAAECEDWMARSRDALGTGTFGEAMQQCTVAFSDCERKWSKLVELRSDAAPSPDSQSSTPSADAFAFFGMEEPVAAPQAPSADDDEEDPFDVKVEGSDGIAESAAAAPFSSSSSFMAASLGGRGVLSATHTRGRVGPFETAATFEDLETAWAALQQRWGDLLVDASLQ